MEHELEITAQDSEGRGVGRLDGKVVFVEGAVIGERVAVRIRRKRPNYDIAEVTKVLRASALRVTPPCPYFGRCGGCAIQHIEPSAQVALKQRALEDGFMHLADVRPAQILPPMYGPNWSYRHRARLSVRYVPKKGGVLVGFRERQGRYVTDMEHCAILTPEVSGLIKPLRELIALLSEPKAIPQIEVAVGDAATVFVLRHMQALTAADINLLHEFAARHNIVWWLQPKGPETAHPLNRDDINRLYYDLPEFGLRMHFQPSDFTQVNVPINRRLVSQAVALLQPQKNDVVFDLFCGLGNFSLPLATKAERVVGFEGSASLVERAQQAAQAHGLAEKTQFMAVNLFEVDSSWWLQQEKADRVLIDPPRDGALAIATAIAALPNTHKPRQVVYVSCNPATLARDAGIFVKEGGYQLAAAGVVNMFPHTRHVESIAVFTLS